MILYLSGTGNSSWVAKTVAKTFDDRLFSISDLYDGDNSAFAKLSVLSKQEKIIFIFPVYSWGIPPFMQKFIELAELELYDNNPVYGIFTCGDECGLTRDMFIRLASGKGWKCDPRNTYSIQMPNNYIVLPGFDIDGEDIQKRKIEKAKETLPRIMQAIKNDDFIDEYTKGSLSYLKSRIIYPLFCKHAMSSKPFRATESCTACGLCVKVCPAKNITIAIKQASSRSVTSTENDENDTQTKGAPVWDNNCTQCLACIHRCPERAIEYGKITRKKGRYYYK